MNWEPTRWGKGKIIIEKRQQKDGSFKFRIGLRDNPNVCLSKHEKWFDEPMASNCVGNFFEECRFDTLEEAMEMANNQCEVTKFYYELWST